MNNFRIYRDSENLESIWDALNRGHHTAVTIDIQRNPWENPVAALELVSLINKSQTPIKIIISTPCSDIVLKSFNKSPAVVGLDISSPSISVMPEGFLSLQKKQLSLPSLSSINMSNTILDTNSLSFLDKHLRFNTNLEEVNLSYCKINQSATWLIEKLMDNSQIMVDLSFVNIPCYTQGYDFNLRPYEGYQNLGEYYWYDEL